MSSPTLAIYTVKQIGNGYLVTINDEKLVETFDPDYVEALSRLITYLTNKFNEAQKEEE